MKRILSPLYSFRISETGTWIAPLDRMPYAKYTPYNYLIVENKDEVDIELIVNGTVRKRVPAGVVMELEAPTIPNIYELRIDGVTNPNRVEVSLQKLPDLRSALYKMMGWMK